MGNSWWFWGVNIVLIVLAAATFVVELLGLLQG